MAEVIEHQLDCVFCREMAGGRDTNFAKRYPEISSRAVGKTDNLVAFPCIGQLTEGHFLVVPRRHVTTFRDASHLNSGIWTEFDELVRHVHGLLDLEVNDSLFFEHGASCLEQGGCGIYHAHIHVVPGAAHINLNPHFDLISRDVSTQMIDAWSRLPEDGPYVACGSSKHGFWGHAIEEALPSQTLRRLVASELDVAAWDWRQAGREHGMLKVLKKAACL